MALSVAGARHAAGAQQFVTDGLLMDMTSMDRIIAFDPEQGTIRAEAGIRWPAIEAYLKQTQGVGPGGWTLAQRQGVPIMSLGGSLGANAHGDRLGFKPMVGDVESFTLVDPHGRLQHCSRERNSELFRLAIGGYGLFGAITSVSLRLAPRRKVRTAATILDSEAVVTTMEEWQGDGYLRGAFELGADPGTDDFLRKGLLTGYRPAEADAPVSSPREGPTAEDWKLLVYLLHVDPAQAFAAYSRQRLSLGGQTLWSDALEPGVVYVENNHQWLDQKLGAATKATDVLFELFVPRGALVSLLEFAREDFRQSGVKFIYGTIRLIEKDDETFLAWARGPYACAVFYLHTVHTSEGVHQTASVFRRLVDKTIQLGGTFYLTYDRFATRQQIEACHPQFVEFLKKKRAWDPEERFQSDWYRAYRAMFADVL